MGPRCEPRLCSSRPRSSRSSSPTRSRRSSSAASARGLPTDVLSSEATLRVLWFTVWQAAASTVLTLVLGLPLAWVVARFDFRADR